MTLPIHHTLIRLAHENQAIRPYLVPILKSAGLLQVLPDDYIEQRALPIKSKDLTQYDQAVSVEDLHPKHKEEISDYDITIVGEDAVQAIEIARKLQKGLAQGRDLCSLSPGICRRNLGLTRDKMPQIEDTKTIQEMLSSKDTKVKGEAMLHAGGDPKSDKTVLEHLLDHLKAKSIAMEEMRVPAGTLHATQAEIKADKVFSMADTYLRGDFDDITDSVIVSRDGHILDGHHRWAAILTINPFKEMTVLVVDLDMKDLLKEAQAVPGVYAADLEGNPLPKEKQEAYKTKKGSLRSQIIRLAYQNRDLRSSLLRLL